MEKRLTKILFVITITALSCVFAQHHHDHGNTETLSYLESSTSVISRDSTKVPNGEFSLEHDHGDHHDHHQNSETSVTRKNEPHDHTSHDSSVSHDHASHGSNVHHHEEHKPHQEMKHHSTASERDSLDYEHMMNDQPPLDSINKLNKEAVKNSNNKKEHEHQKNPGHAHGGHDMSNMDMMHMAMTFHTGVDEVVLFKEWKISNIGGMIGSVIAIMVLGAMYEGLKYFREYLFKRYVTSMQFSTVAVTGESGRASEIHKVESHRMMSLAHAVQTLLHVVQIVISYFLMLIFMTYNVWLCLAVVIGSGIGFFVFGWRKATVIDITEHCH